MKLEQKRSNIWVGRAKSALSRTSAYFGYLNFGILLLTFHSVAGYKYMPLEFFLVGGMVALFVISAIDYFIILPSEQAFINQQIARHENPIYETIKEIQEELKK